MRRKSAGGVVARTEPHASQQKRAPRAKLGASRNAPHGKDEVTRAVIASAASLFAERGPKEVSIRDVARHARVNHGLVHRHFGSKDELVKSVMKHLAEELHRTSAAGAKVPGGIFFEAAQRSDYWRVLARALLDGAKPQNLQREFPMIQELFSAMSAAQIRGSVRDDIDVRLLAGMTVAMHLGWLVFEPFIASALWPGRSSARTADVSQAWLALLGARSVERNRARRVARKA